MTGASIETRHNAWAIRPDALGPINAVMRGEISPNRARTTFGLPPLDADTLKEASELFAADGAQAVRNRQPLTTGGVAVISLRGVITPRASLLSMIFGLGGGLQTFRSQMREALNADDIGSILIDCDSPGGIVDLVPETAAEIRAARGTKPIVAIANTMSASAAYWIASQADELVVTPSGDVGSVGVFVQHDEFSKLDADIGITTTLISAGKYKTEGNPFEPLSDEAKAYIQGMVNDTYGLFVSDVAKGRGASTSTVRSSYGEGRMLTAKNAKAAGMVDTVATYEETVARMVSGRVRSRSAEGRPLEQAQAATDAAERQNEALAAQVAQDQQAAGTFAGLLTVETARELLGINAPDATENGGGDESTPTVMSAEDRARMASVFLD